MRNVPGLVIWSTLLAPLMFSQPGARSIFIDTTSNNITRPTDSRKTQANPTPAKSAGMSPTGLKYYLELEKPNGELEQVTTSHIFHSGERVRLHFTTNVDGFVYIFQRQPDGTAQALFPNAQLGVADNVVKTGQDMTLPSTKAWFTFDQHPGDERLMVFVTPQKSVDIDRLAGNEVSVDAQRTSSLAASIPPKGSRSLFIEVDDKSEKRAVYAVTNPASVSGASTAMLALEIVMQHR